MRNLETPDHNSSIIVKNYYDFNLCTVKTKNTLLGEVFLRRKKKRTRIPKLSTLLEVFLHIYIYGAELFCIGILLFHPYLFIFAFCFFSKETISNCHWEFMQTAQLTNPNLTSYPGKSHQPRTTRVMTQEPKTPCTR